jgi:hypothetical protein
MEYDMKLSKEEMTKLIEKSISGVLAGISEAAANELEKSNTKAAASDKEVKAVAPTTEKPTEKIDETKLADAIVKALSTAGVFTTAEKADENEPETEATEDQVSKAINEAVKGLGLKPDAVQFTIKGLKKSKTNPDDDAGADGNNEDDDEDDELAKKLSGGIDDYNSEAYQKKFSKMTKEEQDAELDNFIGGKLL